MLLITAFEPLLRIVEELCTDGAMSKLDSGFESAAVAAFEVATKRATDAGYSDSDVADVRFVYSVLIDEKILSADVEASHDWRKKLLQEKYFDVITGGDHVFDRINRVIEPTPENYQRQLIYLHCLECGLVGASHRDLESIETVKTQLRKSISMTRASLKHYRYFCPSAYEGLGERGTVNRTGRKSGLVLFNVLGVALLIVTLTLYTVSIRATLASIADRQDPTHVAENAIKDLVGDWRMSDLIDWAFSIFKSGKQ